MITTSQQDIKIQNQSQKKKMKKKKRLTNRRKTTMIQTTQEKCIMHAVAYAFLDSGEDIKAKYHMILMIQSMIERNGLTVIIVKARNGI